MMDERQFLRRIRELAVSKEEIAIEDAVDLIEISDGDNNLETIYDIASEVKERYSEKRVSLCSIASGRYGNCSEDCKFCAQSAHHSSDRSLGEIEPYEKILGLARESEVGGVGRFSIVTSGSRFDEIDHEKIVDYYARLKRDTDIGLCASHGMASYEMLKALKDSGVEMYHHNLETSRNYYQHICTTHSYEERIETIRNAKRAGLRVCSGGIFGMGESRRDRVEMLYELKGLEVDSIPINILTPIAGTPLESQEEIGVSEILKTIAVYRIVYPEVEIRYGAGRMKLGREQVRGLEIGMNGMIVGNYLSTVGSKIEDDKEMLRKNRMETV